MTIKKKLIFHKILIFIGITIIIGVIIIINLFPGIRFSIKEASAVTINGEADGSTTIYITVKYNWKLTLLISLLLLILDFIVLSIINLIEHKKDKKIKLLYKAIIIFLVNLSSSILLLPGMFIWSILITVIMIVFLVFANKFIK